MSCWVCLTFSSYGQKVLDSFVSITLEKGARLYFKYRRRQIWEVGRDFTLPGQELCVYKKSKKGSEYDHGLL